MLFVGSCGVVLLLKIHVIIYPNKKLSLCHYDLSLSKADVKLIFFFTLRFGKCQKYTSYLVPIFHLFCSLSQILHKTKQNKVITTLNSLITNPLLLQMQLIL